MPTDVLSEVAAFSTLEQVLLWALSRDPPAHLHQVVTQDEFTHDVVIRVDAEAYLVFDTT